MKQLQAIAGIAAILLLAACAVTPGHAPPRGTVTGRPRLEGGALGQGGRHPGKPFPSTAQVSDGNRRPTTVGAGSPPRPGQVCERSPSVGAGDATGLDAPCTQILLVPVTAQHPRPGRSHVAYRRRPCWCGSG